MTRIIFNMEKSRGIENQTVHMNLGANISASYETDRYEHIYYTVVKCRKETWSLWQSRL